MDPNSQMDECRASNILEEIDRAAQLDVMRDKLSLKCLPH